METPKRIVSWNLNGLRAALKKGFQDFLDEESPDLLCLQETKLSADLVNNFQFTAYPNAFWHCAEKKGYSGTAILSKVVPRNVTHGLGGTVPDNEGRVITADFEDFYLVNVYTPNAQNHDETGRPRRLDFRTREWDVAFLAHLKKLESDKPVVFCGDLNVAHKEIDLARPSANRKNAGFTDEERAGFDNILGAGFVDTFRHLHPDAHERYSWWSYRAGARQRNVGWRIDYVCVSARFLPRVRDAYILDEISGSDHCPVGIDLV